MAVLIGIDGGGTKTHALFYDTDTQKTYEKVGGPSRTSSVGWEASREAVRELIERGLSDLQANQDQIQGMSLCMSGIDLPEQSKRMAEELQPSFPTANIEVVNDSLAVLTAGTYGDSGVVLIAGTGSIAMGEDQNGTIARAGGYGSLIGDEGSGFHIGRQGLMAAIQSYEGRGPNTILWEKAAQMFAVTHPSQLIPIIYHTDSQVATIASFAPMVINSVETDIVSKQIMNRMIEHYLGMVHSVRSQLPGTISNKVVVAGGLVTGGGYLLERLRSTGALDFQPFDHEPVVGAMLRVMKRCKVYGDLSRFQHRQ